LAGLDEIILIGYDNFWNFGCFDLTLDFLEPHLEILEALALCHVEHDDNSMAFSIVGSSNGFILLGTG
jgi:hypothetical protein